MEIPVPEITRNQAIRQYWSRSGRLRDHSCAIPEESQDVGAQTEQTYVNVYV